MLLLLLHAQLHQLCHPIFSKSPAAVPHLCCLHKSVLFFYLPLDFFTYLLICGPLSDAAGCVPPYPGAFLFHPLSPLSLSLSLSVPLTFRRCIESKGGFSLLGECICVGGFLSTEHSLRLPFSLRSFHCRLLLLLVLVSLFLSLPPSLVMRSSTRFLSAFSFED